MELNSKREVVLASATQFKESVFTALQNELILKTISTFLSLSELKSFRLVNRQWNHASVTILRKRCAKVDVSTKDRGDFPENVLDGLINLIENSVSGFPCSKFCIGNKINIDSYSAHLEDQLLQNVSGFATELSIIVSLNSFRVGRAQIYYPNLKKLEVTLGYFSSINSANLERFQNYFDYLLEQAPALESLCVIETYDSWLLNSAMAAMSSRASRKVKNLQLEGTICNENLTSLFHLGLKLEKFSVIFSGSSRFDSEKLKLFLESQSDSLFELYLEDSLDQYPTVVFPRMEKLSVLKLNFIQGGIIFSELSLAKLFPKLKHVELKGQSEDLKRVLNLLVTPVLTVGELYLARIVKSKTLLLAGRIFPNVSNLTIDALDDMTNVANEIWGGLEKYTGLSSVGEGYYDWSPSQLFDGGGSSSGFSGDDDEW